MEIKMIMDDLLSPERLRYKELFDTTIDNKNQSPYVGEYESFRLLIFGAYINDELVGAVYLSPYTYDRLNITQLFVDEKSQKNCAFDIKSGLLDFVEFNMDDINDYYKTVFNYLLISANDKEREKLYTGKGFIPFDENGLMSKKVNR